MFEYFMPSLFLPDTEGKPYRRKPCERIYIADERKNRGMWGRSECAYYSFDADMNYQYAAIGARALAIDPGKK